MGVTMGAEMHRAGDLVDDGDGAECLRAWMCGRLRGKAMPCLWADMVRLLVLLAGAALARVLVCAMCDCETLVRPMASQCLAHARRLCVAAFDHAGLCAAYI